MTVTYVRTPEGHEVDFLARSAAGDTELLQVVVRRDGRRSGRAGDPSARGGRPPLPAGRPPAADARRGTPCRGTSPEGILAQPAYEWMLS